MSFWDKLWDLIGMFTVNEMIRQDEERIKGGGTNELIKQGAKLASSVEDIMEELNILTTLSGE